MSARLFCRVGPLAGSECEIDFEATIGSGSGNRLVLSDPSLARHQARISFDDEAGCYFLEDLSGGGTVLDGLPVEGRMRLDRLHVITFGGQHDFFFHWTPGEAPEERKRTVDLGAEDSAALRTSLQSAPHIPSPPSFQSGEKGKAPDATGRDQAPKTVGGQGGGVSVPDFLRGKRSPPSGQSPQGESGAKPQVNLVLELDLPEGPKAYPLTEGENVVGRSPSCEIFIENPTLSRKHAVLTVESATVKIRDLGSTNKTYVEGKEISRDTEIPPDTPLSFAKINGRIRLKES